jgi:sugar transferase (PEP-CTERM system associated)
VLGVGGNAARLLDIERSSRGQRFTFVGFIDVCGEERKVGDHRILAPSSSLRRLVETLDADEILLAAGERRGSLPLRSLIDCRLGGVPVTPYQIFCERELGRIDYDALRPDWFLSEGFLGGYWRMMLKRGLDVACSLFLLFVSWPLIVATSIAIRIESPGPILYRQERLGLRGRNFRLAKFRSMSTDAEQDGVPRWAAENDRRVTAIGRIIRATRIDEIPQILNILKGEMSLVGPRPERPYFVDHIGETISFYGERRYVKPGITGWAQINYPYGASLEDAKRKLEYDLFYIKYFSIVLDLLIILQTLRIILWREGVR